MPWLQTDLVEACGSSPSAICRWVFDVSGSALLADLADWALARPARVAFVFLLAFVVNRVVRRAILRLTQRLVREQEEKVHDRESVEIEDGRFASVRDRAREKAALLRMQTERSQQRARSLGTLLRSITSLVIYTLALFIALAELGINLGPLVAGAGIVGVAVGFGAQSLVRDFLSGIFMLVEDQYGVGDVVDLGEATGLVEDVSLRTTRLRDVHGTVWHIPNGEIRRVGNKSQQWARAVLDIDVAYDTDLGRAAEIIKAVADSVWHDHLENATVLEEPEIWGVEEFGADAVAIRLVLKVEPGEQWATAREVRKRLKAAFDAAGIVIPFPQRTVWLRQSPGPRPPSAPSHDLPSDGEATE